MLGLEWRTEYSRIQALIALLWTTFVLAGVFFLTIVTNMMTLGRNENDRLGDFCLFGSLICFALVILSGLVFFAGTIFNRNYSFQFFCISGLSRVISILAVVWSIQRYVRVFFLR